jgi:hypothetical protein
MPLGLHDASVPVFLRYLERLRGLVLAAQSFAQADGRAPDELLAARLAPDMLPFATQVLIACNFTLRACFPLAGRDVPPDAAFPATVAGLLERIEHTRVLLESLDPAAFEAGGSRLLESRAGEAQVALAAPAFLTQYAAPNYFFHVAIAYAILRSRGVPLGKASFDGWHAYPEAS